MSLLTFYFWIILILKHCFSHTTCIWVFLFFFFRFSDCLTWKEVLLGHREFEIHLTSTPLWLDANAIESLLHMDNYYLA